MTSKNSLAVGSIVGLLFGAITFSVGMWLQPASTFMPVVSFLNWPVIYFSMWLTVSSHGHGPGIYAFMAAVLVYWAVLGALVGVGCQRVLGRKPRHVA
jgi:Na+/H+-dicarboxylate symporter